MYEHATHVLWGSFPFSNIVNLGSKPFNACSLAILILDYLLIITQLTELNSKRRDGIRVFDSLRPEGLCLARLVRILSPYTLVGCFNRYHVFIYVSGG